MKVRTLYIGVAVNKWDKSKKLVSVSTSKTLAGTLMERWVNTVDGNMDYVAGLVDAVSDSDYIALIGS